MYKIAKGCVAPKSDKGKSVQNGKAPRLLELHLRGITEGKGGSAHSPQRTMEGNTNLSSPLKYRRKQK